MRVANAGERPVEGRGVVALVSCEHGGHRVPREHAALFAGHAALLASHRGWDAGALELARTLADGLGVPLHAATTTRLLVDLNRSPGHPRLFSELTRGLAKAQRDEIVLRHHRPHREAIDAEVTRHAAQGRCVVHVASHSFVAEWDGAPRRTDIGWLYDPRRPAEAAFCGAWMARLAPLAPGLRLHRNQPYRGRDDGLTSWLRKHLTGDRYLGIELELNQRLVRPGHAAWRGLQHALADTLCATLAAGAWHL